MALDYDKAKTTLERLFEIAESAFEAKQPIPVDPNTDEQLNKLFESNTQAYREVVVGSILVRLQDTSVDLRLPYIKHGKNAYNARDLDERVVNPFLKSRRIPSTKGPFLSVFRRGIKFTRTTKQGIRDISSYRSFLEMIEHVGTLTAGEDLEKLLAGTLLKFVELRELSKIDVAKVQRLSFPQYAALIDGLLAIPTGGRFPVFIVVAGLYALKESFELDWQIRHQGINVADAASHEPGDITISSNGKILIAAEVTERMVDKHRVVDTFTTKIAPGGVEDYIFFVRFKTLGPDPEALKQAQQYFTQGHEVNILDIKAWVLNTLSTVGKVGRLAFNTNLARLLDSDETPRKMKVGWNDQIQKLTKV